MKPIFILNNIRLFLVLLAIPVFNFILRFFFIWCWYTIWIFISFFCCIYQSGFTCSFGLPCRKFKFILILLSTSCLWDFSPFFFNLCQRTLYRHWWNSALPIFLAELYFIFNERLLVFRWEYYIFWVQSHFHLAAL